MNLKHKKDVSAIAQCMMLDSEQKEYPGNLEVGEAIVRLQGRIMKPFLIRVPEFEVKKGVVTDESIQERIVGYFNKFQGNQSLNQGVTDISRKDIVNNGEKLLLIDILKYPFSSITTRYGKLNLNRRKGNAIKDRLVNQGYIKPEEIKVSSGRIMLFRLTDKAQQFLESFGYWVNKDLNGLEHRYWKWKIADYYRKKGYKVFIEKKINGNVDVAVKKDNLTIAIEVETGKSGFIKNIKKDLKAGYSIVISVALNEHVERKIREKLIENKLDKIKRIKVTTVRAFE